MTDAEKREAAHQFINRWMGRGNEDEDGRSYWLEFLSNVMGMENPTERVNFEKKVIVNGNTKRIDVYIPETHVIIEQKSLGKSLDQKIHNSGDVDLTPYEQAKRYNDNLPYDEKARWIITCNFSDIWIYDMNARVPEPVKIALVELQSKYLLLDFLVKQDVKKLSHEMEVSIKAGDIVGLIYDAFLKQYKIPDGNEKQESAEQKEKREHKLKSLNALCVRLVFCLYAEDAGIFGEHRDIFHDYLEAYDVKDCRRALIELFKTLDTPIAERDEYLEEDVAQFPYVNGGLFADETIEIPPFTEEIKDLLLTKASEDFDWSDISPTIFGAVFESTLNPETRRSGGMHYTSIENIHKVIDPLFLDDLKKEFKEIQAVTVRRTKEKRLDEFQNKLASLTFLDPACGSGNFLTETYLSLRRLENEVIRERVGGQITLGEVHNPIKVSIQQFYGIEINDFAVTVAKTAALLLALGLALSMTACGNKESETVTPDNSTTPEAVETQPTQEATGTEETTSRDDTGVYPNATGLTEVAMGVTEDICTFKVPLNYVLAGGYYDENNEEHTIQGLNSATTTVEEALAAGSFSTGNHLAFFTMTSLDADQTMITTGMYTPDIMSWDDFKAYYTDAKEIGDESVPGLLYHVEAISGQCVAVAVKVSDDVTLQIVYEGSLEGEIGEDELGQRLYELVTVK